MLVSGALTLGAGTVALVLAAKTGNTHEDFVASGCEAAAEPNCAGLHPRTGRASQTRANVMFAVTGGLALTTAGDRHLLHRLGAAEGPRRPHHVPVPGGALAGWSGRF